jgi:hypothetical protein
MLILNAQGTSVQVLSEENLSHTRRAFNYLHEDRSQPDLEAKILEYGQKAINAFKLRSKILSISSHRTVQMINFHLKEVLPQIEQDKHRDELVKSLQKDGWVDTACEILEQKK